ncbi:hypothetical protein [Chondromyces crocatus]|uniref:hypothetical protein n=1 Tax=Chondromyces crocatus TaxID=52 RepID=UPI0012E10652|nr:hypothetical protein [Chondromyces crocatus]
MSARDDGFEPQPAGLWLLLLLQIGLVLVWVGVEVAMLAQREMYRHILVSDVRVIETARLLFGCTASLIGGVLADRVMSPLKVLIAGLMLALLGTGTMFLSGRSPALLVGGMVVATVGSWLAQPCLLAQLGELYRQGDPRRDSGFTWLEVAVHGARVIGFPVLFLTSGGVEATEGGLAVVVVLLLLLLIAVAVGHRALPAVGYVAGDEDAPRAQLGRRDGLQVGACVVVVGLATLGLGLLLVAARVLDLSAEGSVRTMRPLMLVFTIVLGVVIVVSGRPTRAAAGRPLQRVEGERLLVLLPLLLVVLVSVVESQARSAWEGALLTSGSTMAQFSTVSSAVWLGAGVALALLWRRLDGSSRRPSGVVKMALGALCVGLAAAVFVGVGAPGGEGAVGIATVSAALGAVGLMLVLPIGRAMVTKLAPPRQLATCLGAWGTLPLVVSALMTVHLDGVAAMVDARRAVGGRFALALLVGGVALLRGLPVLRRGMHGAEEPPAARETGFVYRGNLGA